ncbi:hypothetical protein DWY22_08005 [Heyndrickxia coagulans]|nr:hypothetical protein DWY22_08005 [Heyndrickxia coagulans]RGR98458.1 hypothetical protein DWY16_07500 [Heyndrickxia coagulans]
MPEKSLRLQKWNHQAPWVVWSKNHGLFFSWAASIGSVPTVSCILYSSWENFIYAFTVQLAEERESTAKTGYPIRFRF